MTALPRADENKQTSCGVLPPFAKWQSNVVRPVAQLQSLTIFELMMIRIDIKSSDTNSYE